MANRRTSLKKIRKLIEAYREGIKGSRRISHYCGMSHTQVISFIRSLKESSFSFEELDLLDDEALSAIVYPSAAETVYAKPLPDYERIHQLLSKKKKTGITRTLLWQEYREDHPDGYGLSQFNELYRCWVKQNGKPSPPVERIPGERLYPDYSGLRMHYIDRETGEKIVCELYVSSIGDSGKIYAEATHSQSIPDWLKATGNAFHYYGGVSSLINPDNLKAAITKPSRYDPDNNKVFEEFSDHYGTAIYSARVWHPQDKALAESAVQNVQRWVVAPLRNRVFFSLSELNEAIWEKQEVLNDRPFSLRHGSRSSAFIEMDLPNLKPLPATRFEYAEWKKLTVHPDCHVQFRKHRYSVHHSHRGTKVDLRATGDCIEIFLKGKRIASHARLKGKEVWSTVDEHLPPTHLAWKMMNRNVREWAESTSGKTKELARRIYAGAKHPTLSTRRLQGLRSLEGKYGAEEFEKACKYILLTETNLRHETLSTILKHKLYEQTRLDLDSNESEDSVVEHENIRGGVYYT